MDFLTLLRSFSIKLTTAGIVGLILLFYTKQKLNDKADKSELNKKADKSALKKLEDNVERDMFACKEEIAQSIKEKLDASNSIMLVIIDKIETVFKMQNDKVETVFKMQKDKIDIQIKALSEQIKKLEVPYIKE